MSLAAGSRLGPYQILDQIAVGGMGEVYRARDTRLGRDVALKVPSEPLDPASRVLFERETRAVAALSHPNILAIHDVGTEGSLSYAVLELLDGETLRARLARGPVGWRRAVELAVEIAEGLAAAHAHGIVHRDLKPENVFLTADGHAKILDFGLARAPRPAASDAATETEPGLVAGSAGYMAPEQIRGEGADARSDVFAFGCVLYEMLTSRRAFPGATAGERLAAILTSEPADPADVAPVPPDVRRIVVKCLDKQRAGRFQDAGDLVFALKSAAGAPAPARRRGVRLVVGGILVAAAVAAALLAPRFRRAPAATLAVLPFTFPEGDPDTDYLGDGIAEGLINVLAPLPGVRVVARMTAFTCRGESDPRRTGTILDVSTLLTGSVRRRGNALEVQVDLLDTKTGAQFWGHRFEAEPAALAGLPEEIARAVAPELRIPLSRADEQRLARVPTLSPEAWDLYLKGRYEWNKRTPAEIERGTALFREALRIDPRLALAWTGLAQSYELLAYYGVRPPQEVLPDARDAALRALKIDPSLAEAEATVADIRYQFDWEWRDAERRFLVAIEKGSTCATAHQWYSNFLSASGRFREAEEEIEKAHELDPLNLQIATDVGLAHYWAGDPARAENRLGETLRREPFPLAHLYLGLVRLEAGRPDAAREALAAARAGLPGEPLALALWIVANERTRRPREARDGARELDEMAKTRWVSAFPRAVVALGLGDREGALTWLEKARDERAGRLVYLNVEPGFDSLRAEPRFQAIVAKMGIPRRGPQPPS